MTDKWAMRLWLVIWASAFVCAFTHLSHRALDIGNQTATDGFSEANALRASEAFIKEGISASYGLPRTGYGLLYPGQGHANFSDDYVYTHYPPGPEFLLFGLRKIFGELNVPLFRLIHIYIFIAAMIFLTQSLIPRLGVARACLVTLFMGMVPATTDMAFGLHYQGLAVSLLLFELGVVVRVGARTMSEINALIALVLIGFLQGWLSFDFFFMVSLVALPGYFIFSVPDDRRGARHVLKLCVAAMGGFVLAHAMHFAQNVMFFGGVASAVNDLFLAAKGRSYSDVGLSYSDALVKAIKESITVHLFRKEYLGHMTYVLCAGMSLVLFFPARMPIFRRVGLSSTWRLKAGLVCAVIVSLLWVVVMPAHAIIHAHFIPRHFILLAFFVLASVAHLTCPKSGGVTVTKVDLSIVRKMSLVYLVPVVVMIFQSGSLVPSNWASYHHAGFSIRSLEQPWGRWRFDMSTEEKEISVGGVKYNHGVGTHAKSVMRISPPSEATVLSGGCGVQDGWSGGSVRCHVLQEGSRIWSSAVITHGQQAQKFVLTIKSGRDVIFEIDDGGDQYNQDIANWVDLHFR